MKTKPRIRKPKYRFNDRNDMNIRACGGKKKGSCNAFEWFGKPDHVETIKANYNGRN